MRGLLGRLMALVYSAFMGMTLYYRIPTALYVADSRAASFWIVPVALLGLFLVAVLVSLPLRLFLYWSRKTCGKFFAICCAALLGAFVTYELTLYVSAGLFSGPIIGGPYVLFGGIFMMACPIVAMYRYVS